MRISNIKTAILTMLILFITLSAPNKVNAVTNDDLINQIRALLKVVEQLQQQLASKNKPTLNRTCINLENNLYLGSKDTNTLTDVSRLQKFLKDEGFYTEDITGFYGSITQRAVQSWQLANGIVSGGTPSTTGYGVVGPLTRSKLSCDTQLSYNPKVKSHIENNKLDFSKMMYQRVNPVISMRLPNVKTRALAFTSANEVYDKESKRLLFTLNFHPQTIDEVLAYYRGMYSNVFEDQVHRGALNGKLYRDDYSYEDTITVLEDTYQNDRRIVVQKRNMLGQAQPIYLVLVSKTSKPDFTISFLIPIESGEDMSITRNGVTKNSYLQDEQQVLGFINESIKTAIIDTNKLETYINMNGEDLKKRQKVYDKLMELALNDINAQDDENIKSVRTLQMALEAYFDKFGKYPISKNKHTDVSVVLRDLVSGGYVSTLPKDNIYSNINYISKNNGRSYVLSAYISGDRYALLLASDLDGFISGDMTSLYCGLRSQDKVYCVSR